MLHYDTVKVMDDNHRMSADFQTFKLLNHIDKVIVIQSNQNSFMQSEVIMFKFTQKFKVSQDGMLFPD